MIDPRTGKHADTDEAVKWILPKALHMESDRMQIIWDDLEKLREYQTHLARDINELRWRVGLGDMLPRVRFIESWISIRIRILEL